jgi:hypothetical protein
VIARAGANRNFLNLGVREDLSIGPWASAAKSTMRLTITGARLRAWPVNKKAEEVLREMRARSEATAKLKGAAHCSRALRPGAARKG